MDLLFPLSAALFLGIDPVFTKFGLAAAPRTHRLEFALDVLRDGADLLGVERPAAVPV